MGSVRVLINNSSLFLSLYIYRSSRAIPAKSDNHVDISYSYMNTTQDPVQRSENVLTAADTAAGQIVYACANVVRKIFCAQDPHIVLEL